MERAFIQLKKIIQVAVRHKSFKREHYKLWPLFASNGQKISSYDRKSSENFTLCPNLRADNFTLCPKNKLKPLFSRQTIFILCPKRQIFLS